MSLAPRGGPPRTDDAEGGISEGLQVTLCRLATQRDRAEKERDELRVRVLQLEAAVRAIRHEVRWTIEQANMLDAALGERGGK